MKTLSEPLRESESYNRIVGALKGEAGQVLADGCVGTQKMHLVDTVSRDPALSMHARYRLILADSEQRARTIAEEYRFYDRNTFVFPAKDLIFYQADLRSGQVESERIRCLRKLMDAKPVCIVTTLAALMTPQVPLKDLKKSILTIKKGDTIDTMDLSKKLISMGYQRNTPQVGGPGQFAIRGDIIDIFDLTGDNPVRIELFGDEVDRIRTFDALSQRQIEPLDVARIYPASEMILPKDRLDAGLDRMERDLVKTAEALRSQGKMEAAHNLEENVGETLEEARQWGHYEKLEGYISYFAEQTESFLDLFPKDMTLVVLDEPSHLSGSANAVEEEFRQSMISRAEKGLCLPGQMDLIKGTEELTAKLTSCRRLGLTTLAENNPFIDSASIVRLSVREVAAYNKRFDLLVSDIRRYRKDGWRVVLFAPSRTRAKRLADDLKEQDVPAFYSENPEKVLEKGEVMTYYGHLTRGFEYTDIRFAVITQSDIFGQEKEKKAKKKRYEGDGAIASFQDLHVGDFVVHEDYGIGIYRGVEKIEVEGVRKDYLKIEYGDQSILYILPNEMNVLQKYASEGEGKPRLNKLGTRDWQKTKNKVKGAVEEVAQDLVDLYAKRAEEKGHAFPKDSLWQQEFEEMFPYEETEDQLAAISAVKKDMESTKIMDRLICGDVGFGKTEIAIRAAFKAVQDDCQVAVLVPTTILAQQHYNTFTERMKDFPVTIEMLSRFRTPAENKKTIEKLAKGQVDIVIGTHRLLSKDVKFKKLGLLVVDEEQRFGVTHKERIKKMRENVDVLTLSATPIPRTLHMSLVGIRDMSVLEEAPQDRQPIQTYVCEYNEEMVREAILREISRGGQVYYVYNRVNDIDLVTARLQQAVPEARIRFAHGQMSEQELEKVMYDFISGEIDVLVSTTIIETGMDISNVNTIIIHDAENMGLSQLYQLRGRVGRSSRTAYAFLMYRKGKMLTEVAQKRLAAIREFTDLGSGFRISMRDLEIRGAGSVLGRAQSGHMAQVGYDLYCKMLETAVRTAKGETVEEEKNTRVSLEVDAFIPESYITNEEQKLDIYKKISECQSLEDCDDVRDELRDRFGDKIPQAAENLLRIALIRSIASKLDIEDITGGGGSCRFTMRAKADVRVENIPRLLAIYNHGKIRPLQFFPNGMAKGDYKGQPYFELAVKVENISIKDEQNLLSAVEEFLVNFSATLRAAN